MPFSCSIFCKISQNNFSNTAEPIWQLRKKEEETKTTTTKTPTVFIHCK
jgi:hypothetical protein